MRRLGAVAALVAVVAVTSGCADTDDGPPFTTEAAVEESVVTTTSARPEPPQSEGTVEIGEIRYEFAATCHKLSAGEVVVVGVGDDPATGDLVELYVQDFPDDPYVGLRFADGTLVEPSFESALDLYVQDDVIRASAIRFVQDLNLETGEATEAGFGEFEIRCYDYVQGPPT